MIRISGKVLNSPYLHKKRGIYKAVSRSRLLALLQVSNESIQKQVCEYPKAAAELISIPARTLMGIETTASRTSANRVSSSCGNLPRSEELPPRGGLDTSATTRTRLRRNLESFSAPTSTPLSRPPYFPVRGEHNDMRKAQFASARRLCVSGQVEPNPRVLRESIYTARALDNLRQRNSD